MADDGDTDNSVGDKRKWTLRLREDAENEFDKLIIYISGGGLVLSIGFVTEIVTITKATDINLLLASWVGYASCILLILISHKTTKEAMNHNLIKKTYEKRNNWDVITEILGWTAFALVLISISLFITFVLSNLTLISN